mmetsp:Transcript_8929/g.29008  ORF Transcript_8929/g.29008 Transcript_8929/m.29008 type:complete len:212 (-) Transcript_8929:1034-1669(-)
MEGGGGGGMAMEGGGGGGMAMEGGGGGAPMPGGAPPPPKGTLAPIPGGTVGPACPTCPTGKKGGLVCSPAPLLSSWRIPKTLAWTRLIDPPWPSQMMRRSSWRSFNWRDSSRRAAASSSEEPKMSFRCLAKAVKLWAIWSPRATTAAGSSRPPPRSCPTPRLARRRCSSRHLGSRSWMRMCSVMRSMGISFPVMGSITVVGPVRAPPTRGA